MPKPLEIRFAVMHEGKPVSAIWRAWCSENRDNLMLGSSRIADVMKATFHHKNADGYCHLAVTRPHRERMMQDGRDMPKLSDELQWHRPSAPPPGQPPVWAAQVVMPRAYLAPCGYITDKPVIALLPAAPGKATAVNLYFTRTPREGWEFSGGLRLLGDVDMSTGEIALLVAGEIPFDADDFTARHQPKVNSSAPRFLTKRTEVRSEEPHRAMFYTDPNSDGGALRIVDVGGLTVTPKVKESAT